MNLQIEKIKQDIINIINNSGLPIGVIYYLFKDIDSEISSEYNRALNYEKQQQMKELEKQKQEQKDKQQKNNNEKESE